MGESRRRYTNEEIRATFDDGYYDCFIGRKVFMNVGFIILWIACRTRITPNQITWIWGILMTVSSRLLILNEPVTNIIAGIGWIVAYSMDYMDGGLARLTGVYSQRGAFLDFMNHTLNYPLLFICMGIGVWRTGGSPYIDFIPDYWYIFLGIIAGFSCVAIMLMPTLYRRAYTPDVDCSTDIEGGVVKNEWIYHRIMDLNPLTYVNMMFLILVFAIIDMMWLYVILFAIGYGMAALGRFVILYRKIPARRTV